MNVPGEPSTLSQVLGWAVIMLTITAINKAWEWREARQRRNGTYKQKDWERGYQK